MVNTVQATRVQFDNSEQIASHVNRAINAPMDTGAVSRVRKALQHWAERLEADRLEALTFTVLDHGQTFGPFTIAQERSGVMSTFI